MATRQIGNYRVVEYVGSGGFGSVFKAEDINSPGRFVAVKELHRKHTRSTIIKQRFFQEALAMARLDHPNLPRLYTFGEDNGSYYLVMEFVSGTPLNEEVEQGGLQSDRAVEIICQVLSAVGYAHKNGVIHRDLKPDNVILVQDGGQLTVKVLDFGIAKLVGGENLTMTGEGFGTPSYMSPERIAGVGDLDRRTDIYSLGIILFEMLAGRVPFQSKATDPAIFWAEMRAMHETAPIPDLAALGVPAHLEDVIRKAAAKHVEDRYATAEEMLADLKGDSTTAGLLLVTTPAAAEVVVDGIARGFSDEKGKILIQGLMPGPHGVKVAKQGYSPYKIDLVLQPNSVTDLQVQLSARATVAMPRQDITAPADFSTNRIVSGDEANTALLSIEDLPAGSTVAMPNGAITAAGQDGKATLPVPPGTHEIEIVTPAGEHRKQVVTVAEADGRLGRTVRIANAPEPRQTSPGGLPQRATARPPASAPQIPPVAQAAAVPSKQGRKTGGIIAGAVAALLLIGLTGAAYYVLKGPRNRNTTDSQASALTQPTVAATPDSSQAALIPSASPDVQTAAAPTPAPTPTPTPTSPNKNAAARDTAKDQTKTDQVIGAEMAEEAPKPERGRDQTTTAVVQPPVVPPPAVRPPVVTPPAQTDEGTCVMVVVSGSSGPAGGTRVAVVQDPQSGTATLFQGRTGPEGRWRHCGLAAGHRLAVRVFGRDGGFAAGRTTTLQPGGNTIEIRLPPEPDSEVSRPGRAFRFDRRP